MGFSPLWSDSILQCQPDAYNDLSSGSCIEFNTFIVTVGCRPGYYLVTEADSTTEAQCQPCPPNTHKDPEDPDAELTLDCDSKDFIFYFC